MEDYDFISILLIVSISFLMALGCQNAEEKKESAEKQVHEQNSRKARILLPLYLDQTFKSLFEGLGYEVLWSSDPDEFEKIIKYSEFDVALEWQWGQNDFPVRDLIRKYKKDVPIFLCLNWNNDIPTNFEKLGYVDYLNVPFDLEEIKIKFDRQLRKKGVD